MDLQRRPWRLLTASSGDGAWNLALDEALLDVCAREPVAFPPTLRLYGWSPPALSLGRGQSARESHDAAYLRHRGFHLTRRATGGSAVLHQYECTYAIVAPLRSQVFPGGVVETYAGIARGLLQGLRELGVDAWIADGAAASTGGSTRKGSCFSTVSVQEIATTRGKLVGSAQLRRRGAFLQHGSILVAAERAAWRGALGDASADDGLTCLEEELGGAPEPAAVEHAVTSGLESALGLELAADTLTADERAAATRLRTFKYLSAVWTLDGRLPTARIQQP